MLKSFTTFWVIIPRLKLEDLCNEGMSLIKARLLDTALTSCPNISSDQELLENSTPSEFKTLKRMLKNENI